MSKETMTSKERWLAVLTGHQPDRIPMDYWTTAEADQKLKRHLGCSTSAELEARLHIDRPVGASPAYVGPPIPSGQDQFGCRYKMVDYGSGTYSECVFHPLAAFETVEEIESAYTWPTADWYDFSAIASQIAGKEDRPVHAGGSEPFLTYKSLRGDEQALVDLVLNPQIVDYCLDKLFGLAYETTRRIYEQIPGKVTFSYVAEDMGSEQNLMYSPDQIRRFLIPRMKRMIDLAHQAGVFVFHHNDGAIRRILPDMVAAGIDILNPIQWNCPGMEREALKKDFADKLVFHGAMDNQFTLPFGSVEQVRQEVLDNIRILGSDGRYILAPCHNIQSVSPPENIVALYETGYEEGWL